MLAVLLLLLAVAIGYALGMPIPGVSNAFNKNNEQDEVAVSRREFLSEFWYSGAHEYPKAEAEQRNLRVPLVVYFYTDWCRYCKKFEQDLLKSAEVSQFMNSVIKVRVNPEVGPDDQALADRYGVTRYPSIFVVDPKIGMPRKVYTFKQVGGVAVALEPSEFVRACQ